MRVRISTGHEKAKDMVTPIVFNSKTLSGLGVHSFVVWYASKRRECFYALHVIGIRSDLR